MFNANRVLGFENVKTEFTVPPHEKTPPDFRPAVLKGKRLVLGEVTVIPVDKYVKVIKWVEVFSSKGKCIFNGTNPLSWQWVAKVHYSLFGHPIEIEINPLIPKEPAKILLKLLGKEFF